MCRSIKTLRPPMVDEPTSDDVRAAALQYVRKVTGFREPSKANAETFWSAVEDIAGTTERCLDRLIVQGRKP